MKDERITAPELIRRMKNRDILYNIIWVCYLIEENENQADILLGIDKKWINSNLWKSCYRK